MSTISDDSDIKQWFEQLFDSELPDMTRFDNLTIKERIDIIFNILHNFQLQATLATNDNATQDKYNRIVDYLIDRLPESMIRIPELSPTTVTNNAAPEVPIILMKNNEPCRKPSNNSDDNVDTVE
jgi:hypothetical protein